MSWGYKILIGYLFFVTGIVFLVIKSSTQRIDLVTTDYYAKELKYQDRIDAVKRTNTLSEKVKYKIGDGQIEIKLPIEFKGSSATGTVTLYCPSDDMNDRRQDFSTSDGTISIGLPAHGNGAYELQVSWQTENNAYYFEDKLFL